LEDFFKLYASNTDFKKTSKHNPILTLLIFMPHSEGPFLGMEVLEKTLKHAVKEGKSKK
jgi:hypothetical protein